MNNILKTIKKNFIGSMGTFHRYPSAMGCALVFSLVTGARIHLDRAFQAPYDFLFNCLHWALALGAIFSLMSVTIANVKYKTSKAFLVANLSGIVAAIAAFLVLFFLAGITSPYSDGYKILSSISMARVSVAIFICFILFNLYAGLAHGQKGLASNFSGALFVTHKAFFISLIYGLVIYGGTSGVALAIKALLFQSMSEKVFLYIGVITLYIAFALFVGYFPDFTLDDNRETAEKQPRFVEILFGYIMVPIMIALTLVLLIWTGKTILAGMDVNFVKLSSIAAIYTISGIWLHMMVSKYEDSLTKFFLKFYPLAAIIILVFEAWSLIIQLNLTGLKQTEYTFILIWILASAGTALLLTVKSRAYGKIAVISMILALVSVLPGIGYDVLPVRAQIGRMESILTKENMLKDDVVLPREDLPLDVKLAITDGISYLASQENSQLPQWFYKELANDSSFERTFGFAKVWPQAEVTEYTSINLYLSPVQIDIKEYDWVINMDLYYEDSQNGIPLEGKLGTYRVYWDFGYEGFGIPSLRVELNGDTILEDDLNDFVDSVRDKYPMANIKRTSVPREDMIVLLEVEQIKVMLVFNSINIENYTTNNTTRYWINLDSMFIKEK